MNVILFQAHEWAQPLAPQDERSVHIREVLKPVAGDMIRVALLDRGSGLARFASWDGKSPVLVFPAVEELGKPEPLLPLHLILGHPRPPVFQRLLKDMNSLGLESIIAVAAKLSESSYLNSSVWKDEGWKSFLIQGAQQGGLACLSRLDKAWTLERAVENLEPRGTRICLDLEAGCPLFLDWCAAWRPQPGDLPLVLALGPERGWTDEERKLMKNHRFVTMSLGRSILRTEMACNLACGMAAMALGRNLPGLKA